MGRAARGYLLPKRENREAFDGWPATTTGRQRSSQEAYSIVRVGGDRLVSTLLVLEDDTFGALWVAVDVGLPSGLDASALKWNPKRK